MFSNKIKAPKGYTLIELLIAIIFIVILASIGIYLYTDFSKNQSIEKAIEKASLALRKAQGEAQKQKIPYTIRFQNNSGQAEYSIFKQDKSPTQWDNLSEDSSVVTSNVKVTFDPKGNAKERGKKVILTLDNKKKCLIIETSVETIRKAEGTECN